MLWLNLHVLAVVFSLISLTVMGLQSLTILPSIVNITADCQVDGFGGNDNVCYRSSFMLPPKMKGKSIVRTRLNMSLSVPVMKENDTEEICSYWINRLSILTRIVLDEPRNNITEPALDNSIATVLPKNHLFATTDNQCYFNEILVDISSQMKHLLQYGKLSEVALKTSLIYSKEKEEALNQSRDSLVILINDLHFDIEDADCDFENDCSWKYDQSAITVQEGGKCKTEHCGCIKQSLSDIDIISPDVLGSSSESCTLRFRLFKIQQSVVVSIHTANISKILSDFKVVGNGMENKWEEYAVPIGKIPGLFQIVIHICKRTFLKTYIDDLKLDGCADSVDSSSIQNCSESEFQCSNGKCISQDMVCDKVSDCLFNEDESPSICGLEPSTMMCGYEEDMCRWKTESEHGSHCIFKRTDLGSLKISHCATKASKSPIPKDYGLMLTGTKCMSNETGVLVSPILPPFPPHSDCKIRFSYYLEDLGVLRIKKCDQKHNCKEVWENDPTNRGPDWFRIVHDIDYSEEPYILQFTADVFMRRDIALDGITFSPGCFEKRRQPQGIVLNSSVVASSKDEGGEDLILTALGAAVGSVLGIVTALVIFTAYRRRRKTPIKDICRRSSGQSFSTTTTLVDEKSTLQVDTSDDNEGSCSKRSSQSLPVSLAVSAISPYYEWLEQTENVIRNIPRTKIRLVKLLGKGAFGEVYYGFLADVAHLETELPVAVKTLPSLCSEQTKSEFFFEAMTLSKFKHPNIVRFLGISVEDRSMYLILELMEGGDLRSFVRESRPRQNQPSILTIKDLVKLSLDVAKGCQYLEASKFIHRDIAARNCLLDTRGPKRIAKIGDFGMARDVIRTNYYRKNGVAMVPVKWMPPESFLDGVFTSKTDVWAFGVTLWEIFSMGHAPYPGKSNADVMKYVVAGGRLDKPNICPDSVFFMMKQCWSQNSEERPSFLDVVNILCNIEMALNETPSSYITTDDLVDNSVSDINEFSPMLPKPDSDPFPKEKDVQGFRMDVV